MPRPGLRTAGLIAAMPFLASLAAHSWPAQLTPLAAAPPPPALAFDQYAVDLGNVPPRPVISAWFEFTNTSDRPVTIAELEPSCGCLNPRLSRGRTTYEPGERGRFDVTLKTANEEPGPHSFTIAVKYDDPQPREEIVVFRLTLPEQKVTVDPPELIFYQLSGDPSETTVYVSDRRGQTLNVLSAESTLEGVTAEVLPVETAPEGYARTPIKVHIPGDCPSGGHKGFLWIATSDPEFARLSVAMYVEGTAVQQAGFETDIDSK